MGPRRATALPSPSQKANTPSRIGRQTQLGNVEGNHTTTTIKVDTVAPALSLTTTTPVTGSRIYGAGVSGNTVFFEACTGNFGFRFVTAVTDSTSGPASTNYPALSAGGWTTHANQDVSTPSGGPYTSSDFLWSANNCTGNIASTPGSYTVTATDTAGNSVTKVVTFSDDHTDPTITLTHPTNGTAYTAASWNSACSSAICGTAADTGGSAVQDAEVSIQQGSGNYWNEDQLRQRDAGLERGNGHNELVV